MGPDDKAWPVDPTTPEMVLEAVELVKQGRSAKLGNLYGRDIRFFGHIEARPRKAIATEMVASERGPGNVLMGLGDLGVEFVADKASLSCSASANDPSSAEARPS